MKVQSVDVIIAGAPWRELTFVEVTTDSGLRGVGEVRMVNKTDALVACVKELAERHLVGNDPGDMTKLQWSVQVGDYGVAGEITQSALAALDVACWDILAKSLDVPVWQLLGGKFRTRVPAYANGWYSGDRNPEDIATRAAQVVERGYRGLKIDPFGASNAELSRSERQNSVEILEAVRESVGPDVEIFVEMHGRFTAATALEIADSIEHVDPAWLEEPVPPGDLAGYRTVRSSTHLRIAAGERIHNPRELAPYLEEGLIDVLQVDLTHHAGLTGLNQLVGWSNAYNVVLAPHNVCGPVGTAAALHFAIACPNFKILEHFNDFADPWVLDLADGAPLVTADGFFELPTGPGLGVELNHAVCKQHPRTGGHLELFKDGWETRSEPDTRR